MVDLEPIKTKLGREFYIHIDPGWGVYLNVCELDAMDDSKIIGVIGSKIDDVMDDLITELQYARFVLEESKKKKG